MTARANPHRVAFERLGIESFEELPQDRVHAVGIEGLELSDLGVPTEEGEGSYWDLICAIPQMVPYQYRTLRNLLIRYVTQVLPHPRELQGYWTLTALPTIHGITRFFTLSVRGTEVLWGAPVRVITREGGDATSEDELDSLELMFGVVLGKSARMRKRLEDCGVDRRDIETAPYSALKGLGSVRFGCTEATVEHLLDDPELLDDAYAVCRHLMIHGKRVPGAPHNAALASDVLLSGHRLR